MGVLIFTSVYIIFHHRASFHSYGGEAKTPTDGKIRPYNIGTNARTFLETGFLTAFALRGRVKEGWEPLCRFLGVAIPEEPFPYFNQELSVANF